MFCSGETTNLLLKDFGKHCREGRTVEDLNESGCQLILEIRNRVKDAEPISVSPRFMNTWYIFIDGASENSDDGKKTGGVGGVFISAGGDYFQHFGMTVPLEMMELFFEHYHHPVHELEVLPVLISFLIWNKFLHGAQVVHDTDNDLWRYALMRGVGETPIARLLVSSILRSEHALQTKSWYSRVPSHSNPSDDPSRGSSKALPDKGSTEVAVLWGEIWACLPIPRGDVGGGDPTMNPQL